MRKVIGVITARMASTRLPNKMMLDVSGKSVFEHHVERMKCVSGLSAVYLATSKDKRNRPLIDQSKKLKIKSYRGSEDDILERHTAIARKERADAVIRVTGDMPIFDIDSACEFVRTFKKRFYDYIYVSNMTMIQGTVSELISAHALKRAHRGYKGPAITQPIKGNMDTYKTLGIKIPSKLCRPEYRLTVDYAQDMEVIRFIYKRLYRGSPLSLYDVYKLLDDYPDIAQINKNLEIKGCEKYSSNLVSMPKYVIVKSGDSYVILNENKSSVAVEDFLQDFRAMFPRKKKYGRQR